MELFGTIVLVAATVVAGAGAGVFLSFSTAVMPGLRRVDDRTFVAGFQAVDRAILNPVYLAGPFLGTLVLAIAAALLHLGEGDGAALAWLSAGAVLQIAVIAITGGVHVPRNNALRAAGGADRIDVAAARAAFDEDRWLRWNHVRVMLAIAVMACLAIALAS